MRSYQRTIRAASLGDWKVAVTFEDGTNGVFDFAQYMDYPCYAKLKAGGVFDAVAAHHGILTWPGGIDIAPEAVYAEAMRS